MFQKTLFALFCTLFSFGAIAQNGFSFSPSNQIKVIVNGDSLDLAWAGGLNQPQFSTMDLNFDGFEDLVVFERDGDKVLTFVSVPRGGTREYRYDEKYVKYFPTMDSWMLLRDYNCDGKKDIFCASGNGVGVYENTSFNDTLNFTWALSGDEIRTLIDTTLLNLRNLRSDILGLDDIDNDGDLDLLTFSDANAIEWHENRANCGLDFKRKTQCWGRFEEGFIDNTLYLNACQGVKKNESVQKGMHSGSSIIFIDLDGNGLKDVIIGDISFRNATVGMNTGTIDSAYVSSKDSLFPSYDSPINVDLFPAFFYEDADFDGKKDLLVAPNVAGSKNTNHSFLYKNVGTGNAQTFQKVDSAFLQRHMIDVGEGAIPTLVDIDFDGKNDLFVANSGEYIDSGLYKTYVHFYKNTSSSNQTSFTLQDEDFENLSTYSFGKQITLAFGDLDGDVDLDMLIGDENGNIHFFNNIGGITTPDFALAQANYFGIDVGNNASPFLFDLDKDGDLDLFIGNQNGSVQYFENTGTAAAANFTLVTETFGGIDVRNFRLSNVGNSRPVLFRKNDTLNMFVGSHERGIVQFDSIDKVVALPAEIEAVVGNGTDVASSTNETLFGLSKRNGRNQILYRAQDLKAAGFSYGKITSVSFHVANTPSSYASQGFTIRMKNVSKQTLNGFDNQMTEVYSYIYPMVNGWNDIKLFTPFLWDGNSDVLIEVCFSKNSQSQNIHLTATDVGYSCNAYGDVNNWNLVTQDGCKMPFLGTSNLRPNIRMKLIPTFKETYTLMKYGKNMSPTIAFLNNDNFIDMIVGNQAGGVNLYFGETFVDDFGVEEQKMNRFSLHVFPNPSAGMVNIEMPESLQNQQSKIEIFNVTGTIVGSQILNGNVVETINMSHLPDGVYLLMLNAKTEIYTQRVILQQK